MVQALGMKETIRRAKLAIAEVFAEEEPADVRLEEVDRDDADRWRITISFLRKTGPADPRPALLGGARDYKVVTLEPDGSIHSIKSREFVA